MGLTLTSPRNIRGRLWHNLMAAEGDGWMADLSGAPLSTDQESETYVGLGTSPPLQPWKGGRRTSKPLSALQFVIRNEKYQSALRIERDEIRRDKTGQVQRRIADLRRRWAQHWRKLGTDLITTGDATACYDGQFFFDTDHSENGQANQSNIVTTTRSTTAGAPSAANAESAMLTAIERFQSFLDDEGEPIHEGMDMNVLVMIPSLAGWLTGFSGALGANSGAVAAAQARRDNLIVTVQGVTYTLVVNARMTSTDEAFMFMRDGRSLIRQVEVPLDITTQAGGSDLEHFEDAHEYGVMTVRAAGYGNWQSAIKLAFTP